MPLLDELSEDAADLGAVNTVVFQDGRRLGRNTDWSGYSRAFRKALPEAVGDRVVLVGAGGAGVAVGYGLLEQGAEHVAVLDTDPERAHACVVRLAKRYGDDRVAVTSDLASSLADAGGVVNATPIGMLGHPGMSVPADLRALRPLGQRRGLLPARDPAGRRWPGHGAAASCPAGGWRCTRRSVRSSTSPVVRRTPTG